MSFETKYLIRWGIPGWIMVIVLLPYFIIMYNVLPDNLLSSITDILALGAILTVLGVPLGYLLNQIHHSITWVFVRVKFVRFVFRKESWDEYFKNEIQLDELFYKDETGARKKERYQYLLSKKHELGGVTVSLLISSITIGLIKYIEKSTEVWSWVYFGLVTLLFLIILISRNYTSRNILRYYEHYLGESKRSKLYIE